MKCPLVSIIVPLYNQERFLSACIKSICRQTYNNLEIIIVNDGSTDNSSKIASDWLKKDQRIKVFDKKNEGVTWARRDGLLKAQGEYISFVDSDDLLPPKAIEQLANVAVKYDVDMVIGDIVRKLWFVNQNQGGGFSFPYDKVITQPQLFDDYYIGFSRNNVFPVPMYARLYKKCIIDKAMEERELFSHKVERMGEDQLFNLLLFPYLNSMYRISEVVYYYRYGGMTTKYNPYVTQLLDYSDIRLKFLDEYGYKKGYYSLYVEYVNMLYGCASHLIEYNFDKKSVMDFYENELSNRCIVPRLIEFFKETPAPNQKMVDYISNKDIETLYNIAYELTMRQRGSFSRKIKLLLNKILISLPHFN